MQQEIDRLFCRRLDNLFKCLRQLILTIPHTSNLPSQASKTNDVQRDLRGIVSKLNYTVRSIRDKGCSERIAKFERFAPENRIQLFDLPEAECGHDELSMMFVLVSLTHQQAITQKPPQECSRPGWLLEVVTLMYEDICEARGARQNQPLIVEEAKGADDAVVGYCSHKVQVGLAIWSLEELLSVAQEGGGSPGLWGTVGMRRGKNG